MKSFYDAIKLNNTIDGEQLVINHFPIDNI